MASDELRFVCPLCLWSWASEEAMRAHIPMSHNTTHDRFDAVMEESTNAINYHVGVNERLTAENARLTRERDVSRVDIDVWRDSEYIERGRRERAEAERDALAATVTSLREQFERVMAASCDACNGIADREHWWVCVSARAALAAASEGEGGG